MTIEELKALDTQKAAAFYGGSPDGQWDKEAAVFLRLAPEILALVEEANSYCFRNTGEGELYRVVDAFNTKLESL